MGRFLLRRALSGVAVVWSALTVTFLALHAKSGDIGRQIFGAGLNPTKAQLASIRSRFGLNHPLVVQYWDYIRGVVHGNFGTSYATGRPAMSVVASQAWPTLELVFGAIALGSVMALAVAVGSAGRPIPRRLASALEISLISAPSFWIGIFLLSLFSFRWHFFPVVGSSSFRSLVLPCVTLALWVAAGMSQLLRYELEYALEQPFAVTVLARGSTQFRLRWRHALRHAIAPILVFIGLYCVELIGSVVAIEVLFARQGIGQLLVSAVSTEDLPVIGSIVILASTICVVVGIVRDIVQSRLDVRLRVLVS